ncbi:hypothetical protein [Providencia sp. PROV148]|uniref:hypothetical protein n=1 Tax=Providencia sp. PROV148 TaxID=2949858 RepID=UPI00234B03F8|nr:hypothetical protein [Providencia sp. PROV148]
MMLIIKLIRVTLMILGVGITSTAWAVVNLDFSNYRNNTIQILGGSVTGLDFADNDTRIVTTQEGSRRVYSNIFPDPKMPNSGRIIQYFGTEGQDRCPSGWYPTIPMTLEEKNIFAQWVNTTFFSQQLILAWYGGIRPSYEFYDYPAIQWMAFTCMLPDGMWFRGTIRTESTEIVVPPPHKDVSICSLNSQNLNLNYSATSLTVTGLMQSTELNISCTAGDAKDYQLKLTGSNVINGRLNFGNGVSAEITLNGVSVKANGDAIKLDKLASKNIPVSATLIGTANSSGVSSANGIIVLEAL